MCIFVCCPPFLFAFVRLQINLCWMKPRTFFPPIFRLGKLYFSSLILSFFPLQIRTGLGHWERTIACSPFGLPSWKKEAEFLGWFSAVPLCFWCVLVRRSLGSQLNWLLVPVLFQSCPPQTGIRNSSAITSVIFPFEPFAVKCLAEVRVCSVGTQRVWGSGLCIRLSSEELLCFIRGLPSTDCPPRKKVN